LFIEEKTDDPFYQDIDDDAFSEIPDELYHQYKELESEFFAINDKIRVLTGNINPSDYYARERKEIT
jgi:hypothetical protein